MLHTNRKMADEQPVVWQENKTNSERFGYVLDNEIATDVCFEVGPPEGNVGLVRAHKVFLLASSPVFEAMFTGGLTEARPDHGNIRIPDIDVTTFKEMLRYIYCETANVTADTALPLMYAAKKYLIFGIVAECRKVLEKGINEKTVCIVLEQSISFEEDELKLKCLEFITKNTRRVLNSEAFVHLSRDALDDIVDLDPLALSSERDVYEYCLKWATHQLQEAGNESPSDEQIRDQLGNVLYKIRFPAMSQKDFAELTAESTVLAEEEKNGIYVYMTLGKRLESLKFVAQKRRRAEEYPISRFGRIRGANWTCCGHIDAIRIKTTSDIHLTGVGLYGGTGASTHNVTVTVSKGDETLSTMQTTMTSDGRQQPIKVELEEPIHIDANTLYTVSVVIIGPDTWSGEKGRNACDLPESGRITFSDAALSGNCTYVHYGQIPQLFYWR